MLNPGQGQVCQGVIPVSAAHIGVGAREPALFHIDLGWFFAACGMGPQHHVIGSSVFVQGHCLAGVADNAGQLGVVPGVSAFFRDLGAGDAQGPHRVPDRDHMDGDRAAEPVPERAGRGVVRGSLFVPVDGFGPGQQVRGGHAQKAAFADQAHQAAGRVCAPAEPEDEDAVSVCVVDQGQACVIVVIGGNNYNNPRSHVRLA